MIDRPVSVLTRSADAALRGHFLYRLRRNRLVNAALHTADVPVWGTVPGVDHPVRILRVSHASYRWTSATPEPEVVAAFQDLRRPTGKAFWDVGANFGYYTWLLGGGVMFEPDPRNASLIRATLSRLTSDGYELVEAAASDTAGTASFERDLHTSGRGHVSENGMLPISCVRLDDRADIPYLIKVDVEGHELAVLRGAERTLREHHPVVMVEQAYGAPGAVEFLRDLGYDCRHIGHSNYLATPSSPPRLRPGRSTSHRSSGTAPTAS